MMTDVVVKGLAVAGGGLAGGLGLGLMTQLAARGFTRGKPPRWSILTVRLLGGLICGWLVALWLFGGGGSGIGGSGGWFGGAGSGTGEGVRSTDSETKERENKKNAAKTTTTAEKLQVEILVKAVLEKWGVDASRCYRIDAGGGPRLLTRAEVEEAIQNRRRDQPPLRRLEIVLYKEDSPDKGNPVVTSLEDWAKKLKLEVDVYERDADAPR